MSPGDCSDRLRRWRCLPLAWALAALTGCASTIATPDPDVFTPPPRDAITFWGHACCYIDVDGFGIVTDPVFDSWTWGRNRKVGSPPSNSYAAARIILISHAHDDHLSAKTIATFPESTLVLCPEPAARDAAVAGRPVRAMRLGDVHEFAGGKIHAVAAHHPGSRRGIDAEADGRALGYVIESAHGAIYYSGDSDLFDGFAAIRGRYEPRILILNVNGHLKGGDAVEAALATGAEVVVPVHHGVYGLLFWGPARRPRSADLLEKSLGSTLHVLAVGASLPLRVETTPARSAP